MSDNAHRTSATRQSWPNVQPLPAAHARLAVERVFTEHEYTRLACGVIPEHMEDKWFIFLEDATLFFHRSWTGFCIFEVILAKQGATYAIVDVLVNRDPSQYSGSSEAYDQQVLLFLIDNLLLGGSRPLPLHSGVPAGIATALYSHHVVGGGRKEPKVIELNDLWRWFWAWLWWLVKPLLYRLAPICYPFTGRKPRNIKEDHR